MSRVIGPAVAWSSSDLPLTGRTEKYQRHHQDDDVDREQQGESGRGEPELELIDPVQGRCRGVRSSRQETDRGHRPEHLSSGLLAEPASLYPPSSLQRHRALPTVNRGFIGRAGAGRTCEHQEGTAGAVRKLLGGAPVDQASNRAVAARANDQQIERRAVQRELLGRLTVGGVWLDVTERCDPSARILEEALGRVSDGPWPENGV